MSRSTNSNKNVNKNTLRPYTVMCTDIYLLWILIVFPLYYADGYFHLPEKKATFWVTSTLIYVIVCLLGAVVTAFSMKENWSMENFKKNITMTDIFMFGFLISNLIALAMSNNVQESWMATGGRYYGARVLLLVCVVYFLVSRYAWLNQVFIIAFLIGGNGVCLLATFDYFWLDVLGINQQMQESDWYLFISTMGNANTCASYVCMAIAGAMLYYCVAKSWKGKLFAGVSIVNCCVGLVTARSDSASVGIAALIILLVVLVMMEKIQWNLVLQSFVILVFGLIGFAHVRKIYAPTIQEHRWYDTGIPRVLWRDYKLLYMVLIILVVIYAVLYFIDKKEIRLKKKTKIGIYAICSSVVLVVALFIAKEVNLIQLFKDSIGIGNIQVAGNRKYIYSKTVQTYAQLPLHQKIFGCGQASISKVLNQYFGNELSGLGININSAHNSVLDYLIITGIVGVICYLGTIIVIVKHGIETIKNNGLALVTTGCIVAYFAQGLFNIEQTNTTPIFWLFIALTEALYRQYTKEECKVM